VLTCAIWISSAYMASVISQKETVHRLVNLGYLLSKSAAIRHLKGNEGPEGFF